MKFSHSLQFNTVPEWSSQYLAYSSLKKLIYALQKNQLQEQAKIDGDEELLLLGTLSKHFDPSAEFLKLLDRDLVKIDSFYKEKEDELFNELVMLQKDVQNYRDALLHSQKSFMNKNKDEASSKPKTFNPSSIPQTTNSKNGSYKDHDNNLHISDINDDVVSNLESRGSFSRISLEYDVRRNVLSHTAPEIYGDVNDESDDEDDEDDSDEGHKGLLKDRKQKKKTKGSKYLLKKKNSSLEINNLSLNDAFMILGDLRITLKKRIIQTYTVFSELKLYIELNYTGFSKILKKFDKTLNTSLKQNFMENILPIRSYIFKPDTLSILNNKINDIVVMYSQINTNGSLDIARSELKLHLREHIVWERNTVWRDMINIERQSQAANIFNNAKLAIPKKQYDSKLTTAFLLNYQFLVKTAVIVFLSGILLVFSPFQEKEQRHCFSLVICASLFWATETIPLFVTSLGIPFFVIILGVLKYDDITHENFGKQMIATDASKYIFSTMWSSVIMLLLGGFTLAAALLKHSITRIFSTMILSKSGTNPRTILLVIMFISLFVSAIVSNVAAPVLCYSIIQPLLRNLPTGSNFATALILGVAFASNLGGMSSPISSPQNIIAIELMTPQPSWIQWFIISIPVCCLCAMLIWWFLVTYFKVSSVSSNGNPATTTVHSVGTAANVGAPVVHNSNYNIGDVNVNTGASALLDGSKMSMMDDESEIIIAPIVNAHEKLTVTQWFVLIVSMTTILLWCFADKLKGIMGEIGVISLIPIVVFFGLGILTSEDWNNFLWTIVALAMGGIALGKAVSSSGLLKTIATYIQQNIIVGLGIYQVCLIFGVLCLVISTFVSHTVSALILLPLIKEIGASMEQDYSRLLVMLNVLLCSIAMGLPTSGFPNVTAICMTDELGQKFVNVRTFIMTGVPSSFVAYAVIVTFGFFVMHVINF